ncbi:MAG: glycosyltransferase [Candidatus Binatia bacterium]
MALSRLSIVVPTRDTRGLTLACLAAVARELPRDGEIVVVDDGSRDGSADAIVAAHPTVRVLRHEASRGFSVAANAGLAAATGDVLVLLNSDTEVLPGALASLCRAIEGRPRLAAAGALLVEPDGRAQWSGGAVPDARWLFALASGVAALAARVPGYRRWRPVSGHRTGAVEWVPATAVALRADAWREQGPFDEGFRLYAQDLDLCLRLRAAAWEVAVVADARVIHHRGATVAGLAGATAARQQPELLWTDLLRAIAKQRGPEAAVAAARALRRGAALRIALRRCATPFVARTYRPAWQRDSAAYVRARAALSTTVR